MSNFGIQTTGSTTYGNQITRNQGPTVGKWSSGATFTVTLGYTPFNGHALILGFASNSYGGSSNITSISQTGATWVQGVEVGGGRDSAIWYALNVSGAGTVITVHTNQTQAAGMGAVVTEYSNLVYTGALDQTHSAYASDPGATPTTTVPFELWVASLTSDAQPAGAVTNSFTLTYHAGVGTSTELSFADYRATTTGAADTNFTGGSTNFTSTIATFKSGISNEVRGTRQQYLGTNGLSVSNFSFYTQVGGASDYFTLGFFDDSATGGWTAADTYNSAGGADTMVNPVRATEVYTNVGVTVNAIGIYWKVPVAGSVVLGLYSNSSNKPSSLLAFTLNTPIIPVAGWQDIALTVPYTVTIHTHYWLAGETNVAAQYGTTSAQPRSYYTRTFDGTLDNTWSAGSTQDSFGGFNMRISSPAPAPLHRLWYSGSTASANTTWNVVNENAGTRDNSWNGTLTNGAYYWFMFNWNSADAGPTFAAGAANSGVLKMQSYGAPDSTWSLADGWLTTDNWSIYLTTGASEYAVTFGFKDFSGFVILAAPSSFTVQCANSTSFTNPAANSLFANGTVTLTAITWEASNIEPVSAPTVNIAGAGTYYFNVRVYPVTPLWKDSGGSALYVNPASFKITFPNTTLSGALSVGVAYLIQNGTSTVSAVTWQGWDVSPASTTFSAESGSPTFNLKIYALKLEHLDNLGGLLPENVQLTFTNGTTKTETISSGWTNMSQVQTDTGITIVTPISVSGSERYALTSSSSISLTADKTQTENWDHDFTITVNLNGYGASTPTSGSWEHAGDIVQVTISSDFSNSSTTRRLYNGATGTGSGSYTGSTNPFSVTVNEAITESIAWQVQYTVTVNLNGEGTSTPVSGGWYDSGFVQQFTIGSNGNSSTVRYVSPSMSGSGSGSYSGLANPFNVTVNAPITETVTWVTQFYLTVTGGDSPTGQGWYNSSVNAQASNPWIWGTSGGTRTALTNWQLDGSDQNLARLNTGTFTTPNIAMDAAHTVNFVSVTQYFLTVTGGNSVSYGTASPTSDNWYDSGSSTTVSSDWVWGTSGGTRSAVSNWQLDGSDQDPSRSNTGQLTTSSVTMSAAHTVNFVTVTQYLLTVTGGNSISYGTPSPTSDDWYDSGSSTTISSDWVYDVVGGERTSIANYAVDGVDQNPTRMYAGTLTTSSITMSTYHAVDFASVTQYYFEVTDAHDSATGQAWYDDGVSVSSTVSRPSAGYDTTGWTGTGSLSSGGSAGSSTTGSFAIHAPSTCVWNWQVSGSGVIFGFKDSSSSIILSAPSTFTVMAANFTSYADPVAGALFENGTVTLTAVIWQGSNVEPVSAPTVNIAGAGTYYFNVSVYSVTPIWRNSTGAALYTNPASFKITFPNSTLSGVLSIGSAYLIQNGTSTVSAVTWQGSDVSPASAAFDAANGNPTFNLEIYAMNLKHVDNLGGLLAQNVQLTFPNGTIGTEVISGGWTNMSQVQNGTITIMSPISVSGGERYTLTSPNTISLTGNVTQIEDWNHDWYVTVTSSGIAGDTSATVVMVNGAAKAQVQLPYSVWVTDGNLLNYTFTSSIVGALNNYTWISTGGFSETLRSHSFTITVNGTLTGNYNGVLLLGGKSIILGECWNWVSGGDSGRVCSDGNYYLASPVVNNTSGVYFDFTGKTGNLTAMPGNQFKFLVWNTSNTGSVPVQVQTGSVKPTYVLNVLNYVYHTASGNTTLNSQISNSTVTVDFNALQGVGIRIFEATGTITNIPTWSPSTKILLIPTSGTIMSIVRVWAFGGSPNHVDLNGVLTKSWSYNATVDVLTLTGTGNWAVYRQQASPGGPSPVTPPPPTVQGLSVFYVGAFRYQSEVYFIPVANAYFDISVPVPSSMVNETATLTITYWLTDMAGHMFQSYVLNSTLQAGLGSQTFTLKTPLPGPGFYVFNAKGQLSSKSGQVSLASTSQQFSVSMWSWYENVILIYGGIGLVVLCMWALYAVLFSKKS